MGREITDNHEYSIILMKAKEFTPEESEALKPAERKLLKALDSQNSDLFIESLKDILDVSVDLEEAIERTENILEHLDYEKVMNDLKEVAQEIKEEPVRTLS